MDSAVEGIQLPADGTGKITGAFKMIIDDDTVYLPVTVIVDRSGVEIGGQLLSQLETLSFQLARLEELALESTAALTS
jgi:hypothetical protein